MSITALQDNVNWLLLRASMASKQQLMKLAEEYDITIMQALTLCILEPAKPIAMSVISETFACDPSNVTGIVERLLNGGYIERRESKIDRRVKTISLTKSGNKLRVTLLTKVSNNDSSGVGVLTEQETATLKALLRKVVPDDCFFKQ